MPHRWEEKLSEVGVIVIADGTDGTAATDGQPTLERVQHVLFLVEAALRVVRRRIRDTAPTEAIALLVESIPRIPCAQLKLLARYLDSYRDDLLVRRAGLVVEAEQRDSGVTRPRHHNVAAGSGASDLVVHGDERLSRHELLTHLPDNACLLAAMPTEVRDDYARETQLIARLPRGWRVMLFKLVLQRFPLASVELRNLVAERPLAQHAWDAALGLCVLAYLGVATRFIIGVHHLQTTQSGIDANVIIWQRTAWAIIAFRIIMMPCSAWLVPKVARAVLGIERRETEPQAAADQPRHDTATTTQSSISPLHDGEEGAARPNTSNRRLPDGWEEGLDESSGNVYYYHSGSGQVQWEAPGEGMNGRRLPDGWEERFDESTGSWYYYHSTSGQTQWEVPTNANSPLHHEQGIELSNFGTEERSASVRQAPVFEYSDVY